MKLLLALALVLGSTAAFAELTPAQSASVLSSKSAMTKLSKLKGSGDVSVTSEPVAAMESSGEIVFVSITNRFSEQGNRLPNCHMEGEILTDKGAEINSRDLSSIMFGAMKCDAKIPTTPDLQ